ncbi:MAG: Na(+) H(+) antiporter subunit B, partial [uncultured Acidimicrobiales bacterium]
EAQPLADPRHVRRPRVPRCAALLGVPAVPGPQRSRWRLHRRAGSRRGSRPALRRGRRRRGPPHRSRGAGADARPGSRARGAHRCCSVARRRPVPRVGEAQRGSPAARDGEDHDRAALRHRRLLRGGRPGAGRPADDRRRGM